MLRIPSGIFTNKLRVDRLIIGSDRIYTKHSLRAIARHALL
ncbi:hypothetical protein [Cylindrospermopsis raciborskii]|nr:hypothetical protein [Cylindrospermopsis raciborskii]